MNKEEILAEVGRLQRRSDIFGQGSISKQILFILDTATTKDQVDFEIRTLVVKGIKQLERNQPSETGFRSWTT